MNALLFLAGALLFASRLHAASVVGSPHDLSRFASLHVCEFCHPSQNPSAFPPPPRWDRGEFMPLFPLYGSPTMHTTVSRPGVASRVCLSCHDGVNARSDVGDPGVGRRFDPGSLPGAGISGATTSPECARCPRSDGAARGGFGRRGPSLGSNHLISVPYPAAPLGPDLVPPPDPANGWYDASPYGVRLYGGSVECGSCHNVHDPGSDGHFLRATMAGSGLCLICHNK